MAAVYTMRATRALAAVPDANKSRFVVGSLSMRDENQVRARARRAQAALFAAPGAAWRSPAAAAGARDAHGYPAGLRAQALCGSEPRRTGARPQLPHRAYAPRRAQVHLLEYDEESNSVRAQLYGHKHEVWHLAPSPTNPSLLATCYNDGAGAPAP